MTKLTSGERAVRCFVGEEIDCVPFGLGIWWLPWDETLRRWRVESGKPDLDVAQEFGFESAFAIPNLHSGVLPGFSEEILEETQEHVVSRDWRGIVKRQRRHDSSMPEFLDYPVKTPRDWERLKDERLRLDDVDRRVTQDWVVFRDQLARTGEAVQVGVYPWGAFGSPRDLMGAEELLVAFCDEPEMVRDMMEHLTSLWLALWERAAAEVRIDHIHIWEDMSGRQGSLISPHMVEKFMMPCYDRIADFARANGVRVVSVDTDGDCSQLVPVMMRHGVNTYFPFEVQAGNDILDYREKYPNLGIMAGLDKRALAGTKADIDIQLARAREMLRRGRYIPGFDHLIPPDVPWENYRYAVEELRQICGGDIS